jgi:peroxiredoxin
MALGVGDSAPDFNLEAVQGEAKVIVRLGDFRGKKNVLVVFHPVDWTPT